MRGVISVLQLVILALIVIAIVTSLVLLAKGETKEKSGQLKSIFDLESVTASIEDVKVVCKNNGVYARLENFKATSKKGQMPIAVMAEMEIEQNNVKGLNNLIGEEKNPIVLPAQIESLEIPMLAGTSRVPQGSLITLSFWSDTGEGSCIRNAFKSEAGDMIVWKNKPLYKLVEKCPNSFLGSQDFEIGTVEEGCEAYRTGEALGNLELLEKHTEDFDVTFRFKVSNPGSNTYEYAVYLYDSQGEELQSEPDYHWDNIVPGDTHIYSFILDIEDIGQELHAKLYSQHENNLRDELRISPYQSGESDVCAIEFLSISYQHGSEGCKNGKFTATVKNRGSNECQIGVQLQVPEGKVKETKWPELSGDEQRDIDFVADARQFGDSYKIRIITPDGKEEVKEDSLPPVCHACEGKLTGIGSEPHRGGDNWLIDMKAKNTGPIPCEFKVKLYDEDNELESQSEYKEISPEDEKRFYFTPSINQLGEEFTLKLDAKDSTGDKYGNLDESTERLIPHLIDTYWSTLESLSTRDSEVEVGETVYLVAEFAEAPENWEEISFEIWEYDPDPRIDDKFKTLSAGRAEGNKITVDTTISMDEYNDYGNEYYFYVKKGEFRWDKEGQVSNTIDVVES